MFSNDLLESRQSEIQLKDIEADTLSHLIDFIYTGKVTFNTNNMISLLLGANMMQILPLIQQAITYIKNHINDSNVLDIFTMTAHLEICNGDYLASNCLQYLSVNFSSVCKSNAFFALEYSDLVNLLLRDNLDVAEENIFGAMMSWIRVQCDDRKRYAIDLLKCIRLPLLSPAFIEAHIERNDILVSSQGLSNHLIRNDGDVSTNFSAKRRHGEQLIYVVGLKWNRLVIESFDPFLNIWKSVNVSGGPSGPEYNKCFRVASLNNKIYVVGGLRSKKVWSFDLEKTVWATEPDLAAEGTTASALVSQGTIFACTKRSNQRYSMECFNPSEDTSWIELSHLNLSRLGSAFAPLKDKIYIFGGKLNEQYADFIEVYDIHKNRTELAPIKMPKRNCSMAVAAFNDKIYMSGGYTTDERGLKSFQCFDPKTNEWSQLPDMQTGRFGHTLIPLNGKLYAVGGFRKGANKSEFIESYDMMTGKWTTESYRRRWKFNTFAFCCLGPKINNKEKRLIDCSNIFTKLFFGC